MSWPRPLAVLAFPGFDKVALVTNCKTHDYMGI